MEDGPIGCKDLLHVLTQQFFLDFPWKMKTHAFLFDMDLTTLRHFKDAFLVFFWKFVSMICLFST